MLLEVREVSMQFGGLKALDEVSLHVAGGAIKGLIGPNGSGKTTLFNVISGFYKPTTGSLFLEGEEITSGPPHALARKGIARTFQGTLFFEKRSLFDNVLLALQAPQRDLIRSVFSSMRERAQLQRAEELLDFVGLRDLKAELVENIPIGLRHLLEIARVIATGPKIVLLDEPSAGLNPTEIAQLMQIIRRVRDLAITVFIVEHNMKVIMDLSESISVLDMGAKVADATPAEIRTDPRVIECYLGSDLDSC
jgi:ABC-type branched-subunit amino acid transport system ATPase component